ncbi:NADP-dependent oxidoreductase [Streptomyces sp. NBC_01477]|uniref:NADP-dependent oxidoreductase n=1 Tax=Streptomyces sp. NBC_01477 TaxID=2976015 RepID=UPI002E2F4000|nr:NADP-dependent oxidoreductase [Streptomyces sp. NBC_01477]
MPRAYVFERFGGPEVAGFADVACPVPGAGELLVAVRAAGVNPVDWKRRSGLRPPGAPEVRLPATMGGEVSGTVEKLGAGTGGFRVGDAVLGGPLTGGYAEYAVLSAASAVHKPAAISWTDAATLPIAAATAFAGIRQLALPPGATVLVTGVGGGVGVAAAQIARHAGLRVAGTAGAAKKAFAASLGVRYVEPGPGLAERVRAALPEGVDGVLDLVGGDTLRECAALLPDGTKLVSAADRGSVAAFGGAPVAPARGPGVLDAVIRLVLDGALDPYVTQVFPFARAAQAVRAVETGHARGKVVIEMPRCRP